MQLITKLLVVCSSSGSSNSSNSLFLFASKRTTNNSKQKRAKIAKRVKVHKSVTNSKGCWYKSVHFKSTRFQI